MSISLSAPEGRREAFAELPQSILRQTLDARLARLPSAAGTKIYRDNARHVLKLATDGLRVGPWPSDRSDLLGSFDRLGGGEVSAILRAV